MDHTTCSSLKESLGAYFNGEIRVSQGLRYCTITLPLKTVDDRKISLIVEERLSDYFVVHDGGKTDSALFSQGIELTERKIKNQQAISDRYGTQIIDGIIQTACRRDRLDAAVLAVAQSVMLATHEVLYHRVDFLDVPVTKQVGKALESWKPNFISSIDKNVRVSGDSTYRIDYVIRPRDGHSPRKTCAVKILPPTHPTWQAERFGFMSYDLNQKAVLGDWLRLAILTRADTWPTKARRLIDKFSDEVIAINTGHEREIEMAVPEKMNILYGRAA